MKHYYENVPRLGNVAVSRHAQSQMAEAGISQAAFDRALFDPTQPDASDGQDILWRERHGLRLVILTKARPAPPRSKFAGGRVSPHAVIWFFQIIARRFRIVGYFQNSGEGMPFYLDEMERMARERGWDLKGGQHCLPHDGGVTEWGTGRTREEQMRAKRLKSWFRSSGSPMASTQCGPFYRSATSTPARLPMASRR